jgi:outer membrane receptor protein involved in Fe transport
MSQQPGPGQVVAFPTFIGNPDLTPEKATTFTVGVVLNRPFTSGILSNLRISVDYFNVSIRDAIGVSPAATLQQCLDPAYNPLVAGAAGNASQALAAATSDSCAGPRTSIEYSPAPSLGASNIVAAYTNDGTIDIAGIDAQIDWSFDLGPGMVTTNVIANYFTEYKVAELSEVPAFDYVGTFGTTVLGLNPGTFEYRILATLGYRFRDRASLALQWQHLPSVEDSGEAAQQTNQVGNPNSYNIFALNGSFAVNDAVNLRFGVENLFDKDPPLVQFDPTADNAAGQLRGGTYNSLFYDTQGRRFYVGANIEF